MYELRHYRDVAGRDLFQRWFDTLRDRQAKLRILQRVNRMAEGHPATTSRVAMVCGNSASITGPVTVSTTLKQAQQSCCSSREGTSIDKPRTLIEPRNYSLIIREDHEQSQGLPFT